MHAAFNEVLRAAYQAAPARLAADMADDLMQRLAECRKDEEREMLLNGFAEKAASFALKVPFEEALDPKEFGF